jgi:hypothetical protein
MTRDERLAAIAASEKPNCMVVDLVGVSGMADCASTAHILATGLPDGVADRANRNALKKKNQPIDMAAEVRQARKEIDDEERERRRKAREAKELAERLEAARRGKLQSEVGYKATRIQQGSGARTYATKGRSGTRWIFHGRHKGKLLSEIPAGYLRWAIENLKFSGKFEWFKGAIYGELKRRESPMPEPTTISTRELVGTTSIDDINALLYEESRRNRF